MLSSTTRGNHVIHVPEKQPDVIVTAPVEEKIIHNPYRCIICKNTGYYYQTRTSENLYVEKTYKLDYQLCYKCSKCRHARCLNNVHNKENRKYVNQLIQKNRLYREVQYIWVSLYKWIHCR